MPEPKKQRTRRRVLGYLTRFFRDGVVTGGDAGFTIVKGGIVVSILATTTAVPIVIGTAWAWPIIGAALVGMAIWGIPALIDEYDRNLQEDAKLEELEELQAFEEELASDLELINLSNGQLLKLVLHNYLKKLQLLDAVDDNERARTLSRKRKDTGKLPDQESMILLIESATGLNRKDPQFAGKVKQFLVDQKVPGLDELNDDVFNRIVISSLNLGDPEAPLVKTSTLPKVKSKFNRFKRFVKNAMYGIARSNTAFALVTGSAVLLGAVVAGTTVIFTPILWPIFVVGAILAVGSLISALVYTRYVAKDYKKNIKDTDKEIEDKKTHYKLLYKYQKLHTKEYKDINNEGIEYPEGIKISQQITIPKSVLARQRADRVVQTTYGAIIGLVVGAAIVSISLLLAATPAFPLVLLGLSAVAITVGSIMGSRYGFWLQNESKKVANAEIALIKEVKTLKRYYKYDLKPTPADKAKITEYLGKSKSELIALLMKAYVEYARSSSSDKIQSDAGNQHASAELLDKKEKILRQIEALTGIRRARNEALPDNTDAEFYKKLAQYLAKNNSASIASQEVTSFKAAVLNKLTELREDRLPKNFKVGEEAAGAKPKLTGKDAKQGFLAANRGAIKHLFPILGSLGVGIPLAATLFLFMGPIGLVPYAVTVGLVLGIAITHKVLEVRAAKNMERLAETKAKFPVIDAIMKLTRKTKENVKSKAAQQSLSNEEVEKQFPLANAEKPKAVVNASKGSFDDLNLIPKKKSESFRAFSSEPRLSSTENVGQTKVQDFAPASPKMFFLDGASKVKKPVDESPLLDKAVQPATK